MRPKQLDEHVVGYDVTDEPVPGWELGMDPDPKEPDGCQRGPPDDCEGVDPPAPSDVRVGAGPPTSAVTAPTGGSVPNQPHDLKGLLPGTGTLSGLVPLGAVLTVAGNGVAGAARPAWAGVVGAGAGVVAGTAGGGLRTRPANSDGAIESASS